MRPFASLGLLFLATVVTQATRDIENTLELVIHRNVSSGACTLVSVSQGTTHKGLRNAPLVQETSFLTQKGERTHGKSENAAIERTKMYVAFEDEGRLREEMDRVCGEEDSWSSTAFTLPPPKPSGFESKSSSTQSVFNTSPKSKSSNLPLAVTSLITSGPSNNRVDFTFFADGYTASEKDKFLADAMRLAQDVSANQTFNTVRPLLNFWAAFTPSQESGIGIGGVPKNTPFGLYRDGTELRGVYYDKPDVAREACKSLGDQCDFPILVGNDDLYGGLGGEFTVITPSLANGPLVLRHELGHSIIDVGEEYDGIGIDGFFGINAARSASNITWKHWLTTTKHNDDVHDHPLSKNSAAKSPRVERSAMPLQEYAWTILNTTSAWAHPFHSQGNFSRYLVKFSLAGIPSGHDMSVQLDGHDLGWVPRADIGVDRWHYNIYVNHSLSKGEHEVKFQLKNAELEQPQLCSVEVLEYGSEKEFNSETGFYGAFPSYSDDYQMAIRPTNDDCLMRSVTNTNFCSVCKEGLWLNLLKRTALIEQVSTSCDSAMSRKSKKVQLHLDLLPLAQLRPQNELEELEKHGIEENYDIRWFVDGKEEHGKRGDTTILAKRGHWRVEVRFESSEIRKDKEDWTFEAVEQIIKDGC